MSSIPAINLSSIASDGRALGVSLWIGLALITVTLFVLARTRWGQAKPLSKCVALSIFAHVLFLGYAYGTRLIFDAGPSYEESLVSVHFDAATDQEDETEQDLKPWQRLTPQKPSTQGPMVRPAVESPTRRPARLADEALDERVRPETMPAPQPLENELDDPAIDVQPTAPPLIQSTQPLAQTKPAEPTPLEVPDQTATAPAQAVADAGPLAPELPRPARRPQTADASDREASASRLQTLASAVNQSELASAVDGDVDDLPETDNAVAIEHHPADQLVAVERPKKDEAAVPRRLGDGRAVPQAYRLRLASNRMDRARRFGASVETEQAVEQAMVWLASRQEADGRWNSSRWGGGRENQVLGHDRQGAGTDADTGITGLAILAFLGSGHTHMEGVYRKQVQRGLEFLLRSQADSGSLAGDARLFAAMYCHGMAMLAVSEAYAMTGDERIRPYLQAAVNYSVAAQNPNDGGWRYQPGDTGDMSQFGWQVMALRSAELGGIEIPARTRRGMETFLMRCRSKSRPGLASYRPGERTTRTMTAEALVCGFFLEQAPSEAARTAAATFLLEQPPAEGQANLYYWYYGTLALFQLQDDNWQQWNRAVQKQLLARQRNDGALRGSWDPTTVWGSYGGRVYSTAMATLSLEVYYRYLPLYRGE